MKNRKMVLYRKTMNVSNNPYMGRDDDDYPYPDPGGKGGDGGGGGGGRNISAYYRIAKIAS